MESFHSLRPTAHTQKNPIKRTLLECFGSLAFNVFVFLILEMVKALMHIGVTYNNYLISCDLVCYEIPHSGRLLLTFYMKVCTSSSYACNLACLTHIVLF
jgi:hypothetical protein